MTPSQPLPRTFTRYAGYAASLAALAALLLLPGAAGAAEAAQSSADSGLGLGLLGAALATGMAALGAGIGVGMVGSAAMGALAEKPELLGRVLIIVGLAEGIAIYGLIVSILILNRLG
jgi:V/A-type H+-transporting ATPase subunit K